MVMFEQLKIKFDPSLDRSWCEFFKIIKDLGPKNPHPGCNLGALLPSPSGNFFKKNQLSVLSIYIVVLGWPLCLWSQVTITYLPFLLNFYPSFQIGFVSCMSTYARDSATFFFLPRSNSTHYHKRDLPLITQTNVGLLSLHFQLRRRAKSWLKMLSLLDILPTAGFEFQVISFTWPGSTELEVQTNAFWFCSFTYKKNRLIFPIQ